VQVMRDAQLGRMDSTIGVVRFHGGDVVHQLKVKLVNQFIKGLGSKIGANFRHDQINGGCSMLAILCNG